MAMITYIKDLTRHVLNGALNTYISLQDFEKIYHCSKFVYSWEVFENSFCSIAADIFCFQQEIYPLNVDCNQDWCLIYFGCLVFQQLYGFILLFNIRGNSGIISFDSKYLYHFVQSDTDENLITFYSFKWNTIVYEQSVFGIYTHIL